MHAASRVAGGNHRGLEGGKQKQIHKQTVNDITYILNLHMLGDGI